MTSKCFFATVLAFPLVAMAGAAAAGPSAFYPPAHSNTPTGGPYAQVAPPTHDDGSQCLYQGGPKSPVWHQHRH